MRGRLRFACPAFSLGTHGSQAASHPPGIYTEYIADIFKGKQVMAVPGAEPVTDFAEFEQSPAVGLVHIVKIAIDCILKHSEHKPSFRAGRESPLTAGEVLHGQDAIGHESAIVHRVHESMFSSVDPVIPGVSLIQLKD